MLDDPIAAQTSSPRGGTEEVVSSFNFPHRTLDVKSEVEVSSGSGSRGNTSDGAVMGPNQQELMARGFRRQSQGPVQRGASTPPDEESIVEERANDTIRRGTCIGGGAAEPSQFCKV